MLRVVSGVLWHDDRPVAPEGVHGFEEHFEGSSGRLLLRVRGADIEHVAGPGYGALRRDLRRGFPDRPFVSAWSDGGFPAGRFGRRRWIVVVLGMISAGVVAAVAWVAPWWGGALGLLLGWGLVQLVPRVRVHRRGMAVGAPWSPVVPWHDVRDVCFEEVEGVARVAVGSTRGWAEGEIPSVLLPALRGRVRRLGGVALQPMPEGIERGYQRWRAAGWGGAWGLGLGAGAAVLASPLPWGLVPHAAWLTVVGALLGLAVETRASGWGTGAALLLSGLYAVVLAWLTL